MPKFVKKQIVVEAVQLTRSNFYLAFNFFNVSDKVEWNNGEFLEDDCYIKIKTLEGVMQADDGDWIIKGVAGEFYPCKPDIFEQTYEPV